MPTKQAKIIFTGPVCSGKTAAIASISSNAPVLTDAKASRITLSRKDFTTVAMDYGVFTLSGDEKLHLYGMPGQERFRFMWEILNKGSIGVVFMLDNTRPEPIKDLQFFMNIFQELLKNVPFVIGVTKMDIKPVPDIEEYIKKLAALNIKCPVFEIDARYKEDIQQLIMALLYSVDPKKEY